jgi:hypothetical protein
MVPVVIFTTLYFLCNVQMGPISQSACPLASISSLVKYNTQAYWAPRLRENQVL